MIEQAKFNSGSAAGFSGTSFKLRQAYQLKMYPVLGSEFQFLFKATSDLIENLQCFFVFEHRTLITFPAKSASVVKLFAISGQTATETLRLGGTIATKNFARIITQLNTIAKMFAAQRTFRPGFLNTGFRAIRFSAGSKITAADNLVALNTAQGRRVQCWKHRNQQ
jgi:hypothetical protein